jgi:hypothetical protein
LHLLLLFDINSCSKGCAVEMRVAADDEVVMCDAEGSEKILTKQGGLTCEISSSSHVSVKPPRVHCCIVILGPFVASCHSFSTQQLANNLEDISSISHDQQL